MCGNDYNLRSKGAHKINDFPSTSKSGSLEKTKDTRRNSTTIQPTTSMDLTQMILGDLKFDYDAAEDLKKMKANIIVFELCKITQLREKLREVLQHIQGPQDVLVGNSKETLKGKITKAMKIVKESSVANTSTIESKDQKRSDMILE